MPFHAHEGTRGQGRAGRIIARFANDIEKLMFEASDPDVFAWYVKTYGPEVNLFVDPSQIVQLDCLRRGIWGIKDLWGRFLTYKDDRESTGCWVMQVDLGRREICGSRYPVRE